MKIQQTSSIKSRTFGILLSKSWPWHLLFWLGYILFRFWLYYITVKYYPVVFLEYMLFSEIMFVATTYYTIWLYRRLFEKGKYIAYFALGTASWLAYLYARTTFQFYYLQNAPGFSRNNFTDMFLNNITVVLVSFLFITTCKYFKDGYISQQSEAEKKKRQLMAEVNNLKSQIAPHFLFNTLNNLYGLAVDKSDKLPDLMLQLSNLLRHSLYETQKPLVLIIDEMNVLQSYMQLERVRLEEDLKMEFNNDVPAGSKYLIAPLLLIVFMENAFKHARYVQFEPVEILIQTSMENDWFTILIRNNYNREKKISAHGIGLTNVRRRLEVLYPDQHELQIIKDELYYTVSLRIQLVKSN